MGYAPNNCVMVVVGDVTADQVMALAKKYMASIPRQDPPPPIRTKEPEQRGERRVTVQKSAQLPIVLAAYHGPATQSADYTTLEVADTLLSAGHSSRLYHRLVDTDQLVLSVRIQQNPTFDPSLFTFWLSPRAGVDPTRTETVLYEELEKLKAAPVSDDELRKAKNELLAAHYRQLKTIAGRADLLGSYEVFYGDYKKLYTADEDIEKVTAADIQRVAKQYFIASNRTVATLIPEAKQ
jgi:zinc protease